MKKLSNKLQEKQRKYQRRKIRSNAKSKVLTDLPRLIVNRSNKFIYVQLVGQDGQVITSSDDQKLTEGTKIERAFKVGEEIAKNAMGKGVEKVVFDRNGFLFHGRVKSLAEGARKTGLQF